MSFLAASVTLLVVLVALDLTLTAAIIRKLRQHEERLAGETFDPRPTIAPGERLARFAVSTVGGGEYTDSALLGRTTVLVFMSTTCASCRAGLPALRNYLGRASTVGVQAWAVVAGTPEAVGAMAVDLPAGVPVINEEVNGPLHEAIGMRAYPAYVVVAPDGTVGRVAAGVDQLPGEALETTAATASR